jgi:D-tyrosyl-tRNA(Tyr) deacylase
LVFVGIHKNDGASDVNRVADKILKLRIFADAAKPINASTTNSETLPLVPRRGINASVRDSNGEILLISQFTLIADLKGQNRPSFMDAAKPDQAKALYESLVQTMSHAWPKTKSGIFAADMQISLINDGPVTIILD